MDIAKYYFTYIGFDIVWKQFEENNFGKKNIYLTIDDVITNENTFEDILDILDEYNAKATFFVISSYVNEKNYHLLSRAIKSGHHLANHGKTNCIHSLCSEVKLYNEIVECENLIANIYIKENKPKPHIKYYRPGCGFVNKTIVKLCNQLNYKIVLGSIYPQDTKLQFPNLLAYYINNKAKSNDIIILHDRKFTSIVLKKSLAHLQKNNFEIKSLI